MPGGLAAGSFFLGGQMRGQQAMQMYQQQMQDRQIEMQLKRLAALQQLQQISQQNAAMQSLPPDQQKAMQLGESYADIQKRQDASQRIDFARSQILDNATLSPQQKLDMIRSLNAGDVGDVLKSLEKNPPKASFLVDRSSGATIPYTGGDIPANAVTPQVYESLHRKPDKPERDRLALGYDDAGHPQVIDLDHPGDLSKLYKAPPKAPTGDEASIQQYVKENPGKNRLDAVKAIAAAKAAGTAEYKKPPGLKIPETPSANGWKMTVNPKNGLPYVTGAATAPTGGLAGWVGMGSHADPKQRAATALAQAQALGLETRVDSKGQGYVKGSDGVVYKVTATGGWAP